MWNVPHPRNLFFTGREELLGELTTSLKKGQTTALSQPQAISGLGGVGKTQLALEYAYRSQSLYQAILWTLADTRENLTSSYLALATLLDLPEQHEQDSTRIVQAVKTWLQTHTDWLLILDNADDLTLARDFLPQPLTGHVLLTTRASVTSRFAQRIEVDVLSPEQGTLFLLRRAGKLAVDAPLEQASEQEHSQASVLGKELGWLPLALDQAGAYIEETQCGLTGYLQRYRTRRARLLQLRGGILDTDHPEAVAATWSLSFEKVEQTHPAAADLLRLCAFLAPDAIPEEFITKGAAVLGPVLGPLATDPMELDEAVAALGAYSLLTRDADEKTLSVHRLVQAVLRDQMDEQGSQLWAERVVQAINEALPSVEHGLWPLWERILVHALACLELIELYHVHGDEAALLLQQTGWYSTERARYREAESYLICALSMSEQEHGLEHVDIARDASTLGYLYRKQGKYEEAEGLYKRALAIREQQHLGTEHPDTATSLNNLAVLYRKQGKYEEAEPLYKRVIAIDEKVYGSEHPDVATDLNNLAFLYHKQGKYEEAEGLYQRALTIVERTLGETHPSTRTVRANYAYLLLKMGREDEARALEQKEEPS